jgi:hypothetical protein
LFIPLALTTPTKRGKRGRPKGSTGTRRPRGRGLRKALSAAEIQQLKKVKISIKYFQCKIGRIFIIIINGDFNTLQLTTIPTIQCN